MMTSLAPWIALAEAKCGAGTPTISMQGYDAVVHRRSCNCSFEFAALSVVWALQTCPHPTSADIIVTAIATSPWRPFAVQSVSPSAQLLLIHNGSAEPLAPQFWATADANLSFDGQRVLFAGKQKQADHWQIWEMTLRSRTPRLLFAGSDDAIRPVYLFRSIRLRPARCIRAFKSSLPARKPVSRSRQLTRRDATLLPLTYLLQARFPMMCCSTGRFYSSLTSARSKFGTGSSSIYADGSGVESYRCDHGRARWGGHQLASGDVIFTHGSSLARFTSPLAHQTPVAAPRRYAGSITETSSGEWLVSACICQCALRAAAHYRWCSSVRTVSRSVVIWSN